MIKKSTGSVSFIEITGFESLQAGWERVRSNRGGPGGDGVGLAEFGRDAETRLLRLARDLRAGTYWPGPLRRLQVPKPDGGFRPLAIPCIADRVVQSAAALRLMPVLDREMEDASFGYRPGRGVAMAVRRVDAYRRAGFTWVVDGDIERYFERVPHDRLMARLERSLDDRRLLELFEIWLESFAEADAGLPQGAPVSPLLANLYLDDIDERIESRGVRLVRFADDFLLMCRSEVAAEDAAEKIGRLLAEHGLKLNPEKTRVVPFEKGFRFLGHLFVRSLVVKQVVTDGAMDGAMPAVAALLADEADWPLPRADEAGDADTDGGADDRAPGLRVLYLREPGRRLARRNRAFTVVEDEEELIALPYQRVDRIEIGPGAAAEDAAIRLALETGVDLAWVDGHGDTLGLLAPPLAHRGALHLAQARLALDEGPRLALARALVTGRLRNQLALLRRLNRRRKDPAVAEAAVAIKRILRKLPPATGVAALMGHEGEAAARYWPALGRTLAHGWGFAMRRRRPAPDPVNLVLSFLASLLARDLAALVRRRGLHPDFAVLHAARDGHPALVSDLIEEFRAPLVEGLAVYLFNNRILKPDQFDPDDAAGCRIAGSGARAVVRGYEAWLDRPVKSPVSGHKVRWRRLLAEQIDLYARHAEGDGDYAPYRMDY